MLPLLIEQLLLRWVNSWEMEVLGQYRGYAKVATYNLQWQVAIGYALELPTVGNLFSLVAVGGAANTLGMPD